MQKNKTLLILQIACIYAGALIGAGFASGQEINRFFCTYGKDGIFGALLAGVMFACLGAFVVFTAAQKRTESYEEYALYLFGPAGGVFFDFVIALFLWAGLSVMLVASGSLFKQVLGLPLWQGFLFAALFVYVALLTGREGFFLVNTALVPGLVILCAGVAVLGCVKISGLPQFFSSQAGVAGSGWLLGSVLYVAYNFVLGMVIFASLGKGNTTCYILGAVAGGLFLGVLASLLALSLLAQGSRITGQDIPMLALADSLNPFLGRLYSLGLWVAIYTTALSNGFGLLKRLAKKLSWPQPILALVIIVPTVILAGWPLAKAIGLIYPLLGYIGLVFLAAVIVKCIPGRKTKSLK